MGEREKESTRSKAEYMAQYFRQRGGTATNAETQKRSAIVKLLLLRKLNRVPLRAREREREKKRPTSNLPRAKFPSRSRVQM